jgi:hypothetical protein
MRRYFESLRPSDRSAIDSVPDGLFLVRVDRVNYRWQAQKPYYQIRFAVLEPKYLAGCRITGRLYSTPRALWKLSWFCGTSAMTRNCSRKMKSTIRHWSDYRVC